MRHYDKQISVSDLQIMPDRELITIYRCDKCKDKNVAHNCQLCYKAIIELNTRHKDILNVYAFKLWKEFQFHDGSMDIDDYKEELRMQMLNNLKDKINVSAIDNNFILPKMFYLTYLNIRHVYKYHQKYKHECNFKEVYFDDITEGHQKNNKHLSFTDRICNNIILQNAVKILNELEKRIFNKLLIGYSQKEIAQKLKMQECEISIMKRKMFQKMKSQIKGEI